MRVLIACEFSGAVRRAFRAKGHDAWSCDLLPAEDGDSHHIQSDCLTIADDGWDLGIIHPPCTRLANSGVLRLYIGGKKINGIDPSKWSELIMAAGFFVSCLNSKIPRIAVENPVHHKHARMFIGVDYDQSIQPFHFGHPESKRTCLWLKNLPLLTATNVLPLPDCGHWENQCPGGQNKLGPSPTRAQDRARTYPGIASAMAEQWGQL